MAEAEQKSPYQIAQEQFDLAAEFMGLEQDLRHVLRVPKRELTTHFPVRMDDGTVGGEAPHDFGSDATRCTGDQSPATLKLCHGALKPTTRRKIPAGLRSAVDEPADPA